MKSHSTFLFVNSKLVHQVRKLFAFKADADDPFKLFAGHSASSISGHTVGVQSVNFSLPAHFTLQTTALSST